MADSTSPRPKRASRFSARSLFNLKTPARHVPRGSGLHLRRSLGNDGPRGADISMEEETGFDHREESRESASSRLRRGGSKILSIFGLRKSGSNQSSTDQSYPSTDSRPSNLSSSDNYSDPAVERERALAIVRDAASPRSNPSASYLFNDGTGSVTPVPVAVSPTALARKSLSPAGSSESETRTPLSSQPRTPLSELAQPAAISINQPLLLSPVLLHSRRSSPGFSHMLSHKISTTFAYPTIIHRPHKRSRPSVVTGESTVAPQPPQQLELFPMFTQSELPPENLQHPGSAGDQTDPSSHITSGNTSSPREGMAGTSTAHTSLMSENSARKVSEYRRAIQPLLVKAKSLSVLESAPPLPETPFRPDPPQEPLVLAPTIRTVETTASAKVFFETHFNSILQTPVSRRSQRRLNLEYRLHTTPLTHEQRCRQRRDWSRGESEHLRQERVMKAKMNDPSSQKGVSVAGYEVVKILGKGSFGVVRLVREKENHPSSFHPTSSSPSPSLSPSPSGWSHSSTDAFHPHSRRPAAIEALRSSVQRRTSRHPSSPRTVPHVYAMKVIRKSSMIKNAQEGHLRAERDFLVGSEGSRWVIPLVAAFQDRTNLYLVMDYMVGGDFLGLLIRKHTLNEAVTRWYIAEMILCVEEAHGLRWIHRDVKPDNFLISASGHLKISDFGLAFDGHWAHDQAYFNHHRYSLLEKLGIEIEGDTLDRKEGKRVASAMSGVSHPAAAGVDTAAGESTTTTPPTNRHDLPLPIAGGDAREEEDATAPFLEEEGGILGFRNRHGKRHLARSMVGTSQYMAPEIIQGEAYDGRCDWWSVGIILYECLYGYTPFCMETRADTKLKITRHATSLAFPSDVGGVSDAAVHLIRSLLREKEGRLCAGVYRANDDVGRCQGSSRAKGAGRHRHHQYRTVSGGADRDDGGEGDGQGRFVYANDAEDIKRHPFFRGTQWGRLHEMKPPFVPKVKSWEDTKYFEEDEPVSDVDDGESSGSYSSAVAGGAAPAATAMAVTAAMETMGAVPTAAAPTAMCGPMPMHNQGLAPTQVPQLAYPDPIFSLTAANTTTAHLHGISPHEPPPHLQLPSPHNSATHLETLEAQNARIQADLQAAKDAEKQRKAAAVAPGEREGKKAHRRPRDKILRDKAVGKEVLEIRKRGAFAGYTYRRPRGYAEEGMMGSVRGMMSEDGEERRGSEGGRDERERERERGRGLGMGGRVMKMQFGV